MHSLGTPPITFPSCEGGPSFKLCQHKANIMKQVCRRQIENTGSELFGDQAIKAVLDTILETFLKTASKPAVKLRKQSFCWFFRVDPPAKDRDSPGTTGALYIPPRDSSVRIGSRSQPRIFNPSYRTNAPFRKGRSSQLLRKPHTQYCCGQPSQ